MPLLRRYCTTAMARAAESAQFEGNCADWIGRASVWPSTRSTQGMSAGISFEMSRIAPAIRSISGPASGFSDAEPAANSTSDCSTKRSPTTRMSERLPTIWRRRPKKSER